MNETKVVRNSAHRLSWLYSRYPVGYSYQNDVGIEEAVHRCFALLHLSFLAFFWRVWFRFGGGVCVNCRAILVRPSHVEEGTLQREFSISRPSSSSFFSSFATPSIHVRFPALHTCCVGLVLVHPQRSALIKSSTQLSSSFLLLLFANSTSL